jgi:hypothetical protein
MKSKFTCLVFVFALFISCQEEIKYTGNLTVTYGAVQTVDGIPIREVTVGLFDPTIMESTFAYSRYAIKTNKFISGSAKFEGMNPGNYVVAVINSHQSYYKVVQIKAGQTTSINLFQ